MKEKPRKEAILPKNGVFHKKLRMKIQRISSFQSFFPFFYSGDEFSLFKERFYRSDLGKIYLAIPWDALVESLGLEEKKKGRKMLFSPKGRIALMFLKNYSGLSDARLIEQLNGNTEYQFFCDIYLGNQRLENSKIVSQIRSELSSLLDMDALEKCFYQHWKDYIAEPEKIVMDATCYESDVRYPTDVKLLWECVEYVVAVEKALNSRSIRSKYLKWKRKYVNYSKMRRKTRKKKVSMTRGALRLLNKYVVELEPHLPTLQPKHIAKIQCIKQVYEQQYELFTNGTKPKNRIVSIHKSYVRPIVRGKEIKKVEFGAKVHKIQIGGISFIEHLSFEAFNEGCRYVSSLQKAESLTKKKVKMVGADAIYATNKNRKHSTKEKIFTDFKPKGRKSKDEAERKKMRKAITRERASRLEGSFGKDKQAYALRTIKAETKANEILWIFFGIHVGNALEIGRRMTAATLAKAA